MRLTTIARRRLHVLTAYLVAIGAVGVAFVLELVVARATGSHSLFISFSPAVAVAAWYGGFGPGAVATLLAAGIIDYFFFAPGTLFSYTDSDDLASLATFVGCWLIVSMLAERLYRRLQREGEWRREAQRIAAQSDRLEQLTAALAHARTSVAAVEACVQETLYGLQASAAALFVVADDQQSATLVRAVGYDQPSRAAPQRLSLAVHAPLAEAVRLHAPVIVESRDAWVAEYPGSEEAASGEFRATAAVPLVAGGRVVAALRVDFESARSFSNDDRQFLMAISPRAGQALDRSWQYEASQRARAEAENERARADEELAGRQRVEVALRASEARYRSLAARTSRLHALSAALSEAVTLDAVARAVVHFGKIVVGATMGEVKVLVDGGRQFETLCVEDDTGQASHAGTRVALEPGLCSAAAIETRRPVFIGSFEEWQERYARSASLAADGGFASSASLPLLADTTAIGVLELHFTVPVNFDDEYQSLLVSVAQHCAQALDRARLYEAAQEARKEAEAANRVKDEFLSIVSHELRTPLNSILGWASMLRRGMLDAAGSTRALGAIHDNATRQARLIDDLLDLSRIVAGRARLELQPIDLQSLVRGVVDSVVPAATAANVTIDAGVVPSVTITGDMRRLEQVFLNILGNALKFTPAGGRVVVEAHQEDDGCVAIAVTDTGVGIDPAFLPHVFDRFRQADGTMTRSRGGLGLGLSIAKQLVDAHGGTIDAESAGQGQGSTFRVRLPLGARMEPADITPRPDTAAPKAVESPRLDGIRVLVVDDEADAREMMARALGACGAQVVVAGGAADALDILSRSRVDVLLADLAMPDRDGYSLIREIRSSAPSRLAAIPAAAVTAHARDDEKRHALDAGFHVHLAKPFEPGVLATTVDTLFRQHAPKN